MPMAVDLSSYQARTPDDRAAISVVGDGIGRSLPSDLSEFLCSTGPGVYRQELFDPVFSQ